MKRSIADARRMLDTHAKSLNPEAYRQYNNEITAAEAATKIKAGAHLQSLYDDHVHPAREVSQALCTVRDEARQLADKVNTGRLTTGEVAAELERLRSVLRSQRPVGERIAQVADQMDAVEADPVAWHESVAARFGHMAHDFTF